MTVFILSETVSRMYVEHRTWVTSPSLPMPGGITHHGVQHGLEVFSVDVLKDTYILVRSQGGVTTEFFIPEVLKLVYHTPCFNLDYVELTYRDGKWGLFEYA